MPSSFCASSSFRSNASTEPIEKKYSPPPLGDVGYMVPVAFECSLTRTFVRFTTVRLSTRPLSKNAVRNSCQVISREEG